MVGSSPAECPCMQTVVWQGKCRAPPSMPICTSVTTPPDTALCFKPAAYNFWAVAAAAGGGAAAALAAAA